MVLRARDKDLYLKMAMKLCVCKRSGACASLDPRFKMEISDEIETDCTKS